MKLLHVTFVFLLVTGLAACSPSPAQQARLTATAMTAIAAAWTPTLTASPTAKATTTPTAAPTATVTRTATRTSLPTFTPLPTGTPDPTRYNAPDGSFSLVPPKDWQTFDAGMDYPGLAGSKAGNFTTNIVFAQVIPDFPVGDLGVAFYSAMFEDSVKKEIPNLKQISEDFLTTSSGVACFRWVIEFTQEGIRYHQVYYMFSRGENVLIIRYTRLSSQPTQLDDLVDKAIDTIKIGN